MDRRKRRHIEQYQDMVARLLPERHIAREDGLRVLSRTVTFQVTEDCNLACFIAGTKILMSDFSYKNIEDVMEGDVVMAFPETLNETENFRIEPTKVTRLYSSKKHIRCIKTNNGEVIICTDEHPFLNARREWVKAADLLPDSHLIVFDKYRMKLDTVIVIENQPIECDKVDVYNLETEAHTFVSNNYLVHNCTYCYQGHKTKKAMSFETAKKAVDMLLSSTEENNQYINPAISPGIIIEFIGGEPLLEIELIDKIVDYFKKEARRLQHPWAEWFCISICSNGVLYFDERVQRFLMKNRNNISFSITIDGNKELHDSCRVFHDGKPSYDLAVAAAVDWMNRGYYMGSKITIAPENIAFLYDAITHMIGLGYTEINANCVYEEGWTPTHATVLYHEMKRISDYLFEYDLEDDIYISLFEDNFFRPMDEGENLNWCGGTCDMLCIDPEGNYSICIRYLPSSLGDDQPPIYLGNVDRGLITTDEEKECVKCMKCITRRSQSTDECFNCPIAHGCSWCFRAGTLITTPDGFKPIEKIKIGDKVVSSEGNVKLVENINKRYANDTLMIKATGIQPIYTTSEHPFLVKKFRRSGNNLIYENPEWIKASDISKPDKIGLFVKEFGNINVNKNIAYLVGRYLGDGWRADKTRKNSKSTRYLICCSHEETKELEERFRLANISYCKDKTARSAQEYDIHTINHSPENNNETLVSIISNSGKYAHGKQVPPEVFNWNKESIKAFLHGYFDADGSYDKRREIIKLTTVSEILAQGISSLLLMFGKKCNWCLRESNSNVIQGRFVNTHRVYELSFLLREPQRKYYEFDKENRIMWVNVKSVDTEIEGYNVYNMSVSDDHTFIANGAIVHNCSAYNYQITGTVDQRVTYICIMHKARSLANSYFWNKYYRKHGDMERFKIHCPDEWALEIISQDELNMLKELEKPDTE